MKESVTHRRIIEYILLAAALVLGIMNVQAVGGFLMMLWNLLKPFVVGFALAYVMNILMARFEKLWFPRTKNKALIVLRRPISLLGSMAVIALVLVLVVNIVLPQVLGALNVMVQGIPPMIGKVQLWFAQHEEQIPDVLEQVGLENMDWDNVGKSLMDFATRSLGSVLGFTARQIPSLASGILDGFVSLVFAVYLLVSKETLLHQLRKLQQAFMKPRLIERMNRVLGVTNQSFQSYISGQCIEAVVLGVLCGLGMWVFGFPYAGTAGVFVGVTALVPIIGAYLGAALGAFLILTVDPIKAIWFLVYIVVLQQLENNLIYPRVVGTSIGLPGVWVLLAVVLGGGLFGILGMMMGVPIAATAYKLLSMETHRRLSATSTEDTGGVIDEPEFGD